MTPPPLRDAIDAFRANDVATVLRTAGVVDMPKTKDGKTDLWAKLIGDPGRIRIAIGSHEHRAAGRRCNCCNWPTAKSAPHGIGGCCSAPGSERRAQAEANGHLRLHSQHPENTTDPGTFDEVLAALLKHGLIWTHTLPASQPSNAKLGFEGGRFVYIPPEIARHLPPVPEPERAKPQVSQALPGSARTCQPRSVSGVECGARDAVPGHERRAVARRRSEADQRPTAGAGDVCRRQQRRRFPSGPFHAASVDGVGTAEHRRRAGRQHPECNARRAVLAE